MSCIGKTVPTEKKNTKTKITTKKPNLKPYSSVITVIIKAMFNNLELALLLNPTHQRGRQRGGEQFSSDAAR